MILHSPSRSLACATIVAIAFGGVELNAQTEDLLLDELLEEQVGLQLESDLLEGPNPLGDVLDGKLTDRVVDTLGDVVEIVPATPEKFVPATDRDGSRIERGVWVVLVTPERLALIERLGFRVREQRPLAALNRVLLRVEAPVDDDRARAVLREAGETPEVRVDLNHVYRVESGASPPAPGSDSAFALHAASGVSVGIVDTSVAVDHEALRSADIVEHDFVPYGDPRPSDHGTAVASILVGDSASLRGLLPGARLHAASVFFREPGGSSAATTASLVGALDWLAGAGVRVVNMSLSGPPNRVLEAALDAVTAHGLVVVAAVGNGGPASPPLYPAAYESVLGITAVDSDHRPYRYANRGPQVTFAAPGVGIPIAKNPGHGVASGTSFAAPHATAILARSLADPADSRDHVLAGLKAAALDLGDPGFDETFGFGLIVPTKVR